MDAKFNPNNSLDKSRAAIYKSKSEFIQLTKKEQLRYFIALAHMAANTHNTQPWLFSMQVATFSISVYLNKKRVLPASDPTGRESMISIGCAVENIAVASLYYGYIMNFVIENNIKIITKLSEIPTKKKSDGDKEKIGIINFQLKKTHINNVEINDTGEEAENLLKSIFERKVVRAEYDENKKINAAVIKKIENASKKFLDLNVYTITDKIRRLSISEFQNQADAFVLNSKKFSEELGDWLLPNDTSSRIGMPGIGFGFDEKQAKRIHEGLRRLRPLEPEDNLRLAQAGKIGIEKAPLLIFITTKKDNAHYWVNAGRLLEKILLILTCENIQTAIHAAIVEVSLINKIFRVALGTTNKIMVMFRAGYVKNQEDLNRPHSPRSRLEDIIID